MKNLNTNFQIITILDNFYHLNFVKALIFYICSYLFKYSLHRFFSNLTSLYFILISNLIKGIIFSPKNFLWLGE